MFTALAILGCVSTVKRLDSSSQTDLSGRWNDTDSRLVAEEMVAEITRRPWLREYTDSTGRKPVLVVGIVKNKSHEHIATDAFIRDIEREVLNLGQIRIVQAGDDREQLRAERAGQQDFASPESTKKWGREVGADFILQGLVTSIVDTNQRESAVYYQVDLELTSIETSEKVWIGTKKIKKLVKR